MVSARRADALRDPTAELIDLFNNRMASTASPFPVDVTRHFSHIFASNEAFKEIPCLNVRHPPQSHRDRALVRFRGMVQDTSLSPEMYLYKGCDGAMGGWGMHNLPDNGDHAQLNYADLRECRIMWAVSVPGESNWCALELDGITDTLNERDGQCSVHFPHKFPDPRSTHIGTQVKVYDSTIADQLKPTDLVTFVGILTEEPIDINAESMATVPTIHVLFFKAFGTFIIERPYQINRDSGSDLAPAIVRQELLKWLADEALAGDQDVAEWVVLIMIARVQKHNSPLLPPTLTISQFPSYPAVAEGAAVSSPKPTIQYILSTLLPLTQNMPLSLDILNTSVFAPESRNDDLHSGTLQLPSGTMLLVTDSAIQEGNLSERGLANLSTLQELISTQTLSYNFPFSSFCFPTDIRSIILTEGKASGLLKTDISIPIKPNYLVTDSGALYRSAEDVKKPSAAELNAFRDLLIGSQSGQVHVSEATSQYIQRDFVKDRQQGLAITSDDLVRRLTIAKLYALSLHESELTIDVWLRAKQLDERRKARMS